MVNFERMYRKYVNEEWGRTLIVKDFGFISYDKTPESIYMADLYVLPTHRRKGFGKSLEGIVIAEAQRLGIKYLTLKVHRSDKDWEKNLKSYIGQGYNVDSEGGGCIRMFKKLEVK